MQKLKKRIESSFSPAEAKKIAGEILIQPALFGEIMQLYLGGPCRITQRTAGIISDCTKKEPALLLPYQKRMLDQLKKSGVADAVKRNTLRIFQFAEIPDELEDEIMNFCFTFLSSGKEAAAIKVFSISILYRLSRKYPELKNEVKVLIEDQLPYEKAAFISRGRKVLKEMEKEEKREILSRRSES